MDAFNENHVKSQQEIQRFISDLPHQKIFFARQAASQRNRRNKMSIGLPDDILLRFKICVHLCVFESEAGPDLSSLYFPIP